MSYIKIKIEIKLNVYEGCLVSIQLFMCAKHGTNLAGASHGYLLPRAKNYNEFLGGVDNKY